MTKKMKDLCGQVILEAAMESVRRKKSGGVPSGPGDVRRQMAQNLGNLWDGCQGEKEAEQIYGNVLPEAARRAGRMTEGYSRNPERADHDRNGWLDDRSENGSSSRKKHSG